jgi:hypothetical protein
VDQAVISISFKDIVNNPKSYFNKNAILTPAEKFQKTLLSKFGSAVRTTQRNSMKKGGPGKVSEPGKAPLRHSRKLDIKETVFFFVDVKKKDVVIGMVLAVGKNNGDEPMPGQLEYGGVDYTEWQGKKRGYRRRKEPLRIRPRPGAHLAFKKTIDKQLPRLIAGGIMREV